MKPPSMRGVLIVSSLHPARQDTLRVDEALLKISFICAPEASELPGYSHLFCYAEPTL